MPQRIRSVKWVSLFFVLAVALSGCSVSKYFANNRLEELSEHWVGRKASAVRAVQGEPDTIEMLSSGRELWTYRLNRAEGESLLRAQYKPSSNKPSEKSVVDNIEIVTYLIGRDGRVHYFDAYVEDRWD